MKKPVDPDLVKIKNGDCFSSNFHKLSHELRTPLNQINGFAELLLMDEKLSPTNVDYVRAILSGSKRLQAAVRSHLDCVEAVAAAPLRTENAPHDPARVGAVDPSSQSIAGTTAVAPEAGAVKPRATTAKSRPESVIGPLGQPMTLASLPPRDTRRWNARRKAELVAAVHGGLLTIEEVCERYSIELEEFVSWQRGLDRLGLKGLCITHSQKHRDLFERKNRY
jgi:signal transduction histidine kinase